mmetsp:Transcript_27895/g.47386  ORF Transcript_27895/g.47386 Transcript_27895/m.47386 type:complete len:90 (-) Transcript_27895:738-1007(-)
MRSQSISNTMITAIIYLLTSPQQRLKGLLTLIQFSIRTHHYIRTTTAISTMLRLLGVKSNTAPEIAQVVNINRACSVSSNLARFAALEG